MEREWILPSSWDGRPLRVHPHQAALWEQEGLVGKSTLCRPRSSSSSPARCVSCWPNHYSELFSKPCSTQLGAKGDDARNSGVVVSDGKQMWFKVCRGVVSPRGGVGASPCAWLSCTGCCLGLCVTGLGQGHGAVGALQCPGAALCTFCDGQSKELTFSRVG